MTRSIDLYLASRTTSLPKRYILRHYANRLGYDVIKTAGRLRFVRFAGNEVGVSPVADVKRYITKADPIIVDVGANVGQTVFRYMDAYPNATIHSFEASPSTFESLKKNTSGLENVLIWNCGLGSTEGAMTLNENENPAFSSFLNLGGDGVGRVARTTDVSVRTLDAYCREHQIASIDLLKSDTQGFEHQVFRGAKALLNAGAIKLVLFEVIFSQLYRHTPQFTQVFEPLLEAGYELVTFYPMTMLGKKAGWTDALFVHRSAL
jgi:FkbM family methyltransferase